MSIKKRIKENILWYLDIAPHDLNVFFYKDRIHNSMVLYVQLTKLNKYERAAMLRISEHVENLLTKIRCKYKVVEQNPLGTCIALPDIKTKEDKQALLGLLIIADVY